MKIKMKPNQTPKTNGFVSDTKRTSINKEKGITLIALIITVIILIILTAVAVRQITGEEGIFEATTSAISEYKLAEYTEMVTEIIATEIQVNALQGMETYMTDISEALSLETTWVASVRNLTNTSITDSDTDIIVRTTDGYEVQVYYDSTLDSYYVEGAGNVSSGKTYPEVTATYSDGIITITTSINSSEDGIAKVEVISESGTDVIYTTSETNTGWSGTYTTSDTGLHKIKVTTLQGVSRYAWVRASEVEDAYEEPVIAVSSGTEGENNWYTSSSVTVKITAQNSGTSIKYMLTGATTSDIVEISDTETSISIPNQGLTKIIAWEEDSSGNTSKYVYYSVKIDSEAPTSSITWTGTQKTLSSGSWTESIVENDSTNWYCGTVDISLVGADTGSGISGYYYTITNQSTGVTSFNNEFASGSTREIIIETDGEYSLDIIIQDKAGNQYTVSNFTVKKDSTSPEVFIPTISNESSSGFTISASTMDMLSGIAYYDYYVDGSIVSGNTTAKSYTVSGMSETTTYEVYVIAYDNAGNSKVGTVLTAQTNATASSSGENSANAPKLSDGMIPVKYDTDQGEWVICSPTDPEWYSYTKSDKQWANIMLSDGKYTTYTAYVGAVVSEDELRFDVCMDTKICI